MYFRYGCMYNVCNSNLLFHASMPMNADGTLKEVDILGKKYKGEALLKRVGQLIRTAYLQKKIIRKSICQRLYLVPVVRKELSGLR